MCMFAKWLAGAYAFEYVGDFGDDDCPCADDETRPRGGPTGC